MGTTLKPLGQLPGGFSVFPLYRRRRWRVSAILRSCADDLVVPDSGHQYGGRDLGCDNAVYAGPAADEGRGELWKRIGIG
jgi:hypothetical protein